MKVKLGTLLLLVLVGLYFVRADYQPSPFSDENLYYYMAKEVAGGAVPYQDFFFAHLPLMVLPQIALFKLFGASFLLGRSVPILSGLGILLLTYLSANEIEKGGGIFAGAFLLSSYSFWLMSGRGIGVALSTLFLMASFYMHLRGRERESGLLLGLTILARLSSFPAVLVFLAYKLYKRNWQFFQGFSVVALFGVLAIIPNFVQDTILYHFMKSSLPDKSGALLFLKMEWPLLLLALLPAASKLDEKGKITAGLAASALLLLALSQVRVFYLGFAVPFIAILAGMGASKLSDKYAEYRLPIFAVFLLILGANAYAHPFDSVGIDPGLERVFAGVEGPVYDTSSSIGAFYSLQYGSRISGRLIDMYPVRVLSGAVDWNEVRESLESDPPKFIFDNRGDFIGYNNREAWLQTPVKDFVYDNYLPWRFVSISGNQEVILVWEKKEAGEPVPFLGGAGQYEGIYYTGGLAGEEVKLERGEIQRLGSPSDLIPDREFVSYLSSHAVNPETVEPGAWDRETVARGDHWKIEGALSSETWVNEEAGSYILFTETRDSGKTVSFFIQSYSPEYGIITRQMHQNIEGGFVNVYTEKIQ